MWSVSKLATCTVTWHSIHVWDGTYNIYARPHIPFSMSLACATSLRTVPFCFPVYRNQRRDNWTVIQNVWDVDLKDSLMLIACGQADVIKIKSLFMLHTHSHTCKKSHFHIFKTVFLSLFGLKSSVFGFITMKKFWRYMEWMPPWYQCRTV